MRTFEDFIFTSQPGAARPMTLEGFQGTSIVAWQGDIERQLAQMADEYREAKNLDYANKLEAYLRIWRGSPLTGSVNVETIESLLTAADVLAADSWKLGNYFSHLRDNLRVLKASSEELPDIPTAEAGAPRRRPRVAHQVAISPPTADFGPTSGDEDGGGESTGTDLGGVSMAPREPGGGGV